MSALLLTALLAGLILGIIGTLVYAAYDTAQYDRSLRCSQASLDAEAAAKRLTETAQSVCDVMTDLARSVR